MIKNKIINTKNVIVLILKRFYNILRVPLFPIKNKYLFIGISISLALMTAYTNYKLSYGVTSCFGVNEGMSAEQPTSGLDLPRFIYFFVLGSLCYVNIYLVFSILQRVRNMFRQYGGGAGKIS